MSTVQHGHLCEFRVPYPGSMDCISCYLIMPDKTPTGIIYFAHGIMEYAMRHAQLFNHLLKYGYIIITNDLMYHGPRPSSPSYDSNKTTGWNYAVDLAKSTIDTAMKSLACSTSAAYDFVSYGPQKNLPVFGVGFSYGSYVVRALAIQNPDLFRKIALIGTGDTCVANLKVSTFILQWHINHHGYEGSAEFIKKITTDIYNSKFEHETDADWLFASKQARMNYLQDSICLKSITANMLYDLLTGMEYTADPSNIKRMNRKCPILVINGSEDSVNNFGKNTARMMRKFKSAGLCAKNLTYSGMRHAVLHDTNCQKVISDIAYFIGNNFEVK